MRRLCDEMCATREICDNDDDGADDDDGAENHYSEFLTRYMPWNRRGRGL